MLKKYYEREVADAVDNVVTAVTFEGEEESGVDIKTMDLTSDENFRDVHISCELSKQQREDTQKLLEQYQDIFSSKHGRTDLAEHSIVLTDNTPIKSRRYPIPYNMCPQLRSQIDPQSIFAKISGNKVYSKLDCYKGYWQIPMNFPFGNYHFKMMLFGRSNNKINIGEYDRVSSIDIEGIKPASIQIENVGGKLISSILT